MRTTFLILFNAFLLLLITTACKKTEDPERVKAFHLSGIVYDKATQTPLDSVTVSLNYTTWFSPSIPVLTMKTSDDGTFEFDFAPKPDKDYFYNIKFSKIGYQWTNKSVDLYKIDQSFVILLEKFNSN